MDKHGISGFEEIALKQRSDDFSDQFSTPIDPKFWIRIEQPLTDRLFVSDMLFGEQDEYVMANAFLQALATLGLPKPTEIVFRNLGGVDDPRTATEAQRVEKVVEAMVMRQRRFIIGREYEVRREKIDLVFHFKHFE